MAKTYWLADDATSRRHHAMAGYRTPAGAALADIPQRHLGEEHNGGGDDARGREDPKDRGNRIQIENSEAILLVEPFSITGPHDVSLSKNKHREPAK